MIRLFDFLFSLLALITLSPILILLWIIGLLENGSPLFKQPRVGYGQKSFLLIKFRSMPKGTKSVATHLLDKSVITRYGKFLRRTKLDELPQLLNVLKGDMSIVGPRPCLLKQTTLIKERKKKGVFKVKPGITGLAQISGIDMKNPSILAEKDFQMIQRMNLYSYFYLILKTFLLVIKNKA